MTEELIALRNFMESEGVKDCVMESTGIYWMPIWRVLENSVKLHLVNSHFFKQFPGKQSDVRDVEWIAISDTLKTGVMGGLRPRNEESVGKIMQDNIGNKFLRKDMMECAWAIPHQRFFLCWVLTPLVFRTMEEPYESTSGNHTMGRR